MTLHELVEQCGPARKSGKGFQCHCPAHRDSTASLHVEEGRNGGLVLHCHAGCSPSAVVAALGMTLADLAPPSNGNGASSINVEYPYRDETGRLLCTVVRKPDKRFFQIQPDGTLGLTGVRRVLYRLPEVLAAAQCGLRVYVVEGEKDADALAARGLTATTALGGCGSWRPEYAQWLKGADVVVLPDNDEPGESYARSIVASVPNAKIVRLPGLPPKGDVSDWLEQGHTVDELSAVVDAPPYKAQCFAELLKDPTLLQPPMPVLNNIAFAGRATLLAAREKSGKSTLMTAGAAAITKGQGFCGTKAEPPADVLWVTFEEAKADVGRRFMQHGGDPNHLFLATGTEITSFEDLAREAGRGYRLIVMDTVAAYGYRTGTIQDENDAMQMTAALQPIVALAHEGTAAWVLLGHANKNGGYRGSTAGGAAVDVILEMEEGDGTLRKFKPRARWHIAPFTLVMDGTRYRTGGIMDLEDEQRVLATIADFPGASRDHVAKVAGGQKKRMLDCIDRLIEAGSVVNAGNAIASRLYLPDQLPLT